MNTDELYEVILYSFIYLPFGMVIGWALCFALEKLGIEVLW